MVCIARFRSLIARSPIQLLLKCRDLALDHASSNRLIFFPNNRRCFRAAIVAMMLDLGAATGPGTVGVGGGGLGGNDSVHDGGYVSGGWKSEDGRLSYGYSSFRGRRPSMEDFYDVKTSKIDGETVNLFGVFDGHGGSRAAEYLKEHLFKNLMKHPQFVTDTKKAISETYKQTDSDFLDAENNSLRDDGSTASTLVMIGRHLYVANVGDSRAVMLKSGKAIPLSDDHKPNRSDERHRIELAGGVIAWAGTWRVGGVLAMSRAFGNRQLKRFVVADPEIQLGEVYVPIDGRLVLSTSGAKDGMVALIAKEQDVVDDLELLVLASDGLWDVVPNEDAVSIANMEEEPEAAAVKLMETAFSRGSADNITCIVVRFHHDAMELDPPCAS